MSSSDLYSHPDKLLVDHLFRVAEACVKKFKYDQSNLDRYFPRNHWENLIWIMGFLHDFGKATTYFQDYLEEKDEKKKMAMKGSPLTSHGLLSAVLAHFVTVRYIEKYPEKNDLWPMMPLFVFLCIKKHHGNLNNAVRMQGSNDDNELNTADPDHLDDQFQSCFVLDVASLLDRTAMKTDLNLTCEELPPSWTAYFKKFIVREERSRLTKLVKQTEYYFIFQYLFSLLLHSDKEEAIFSGRISSNRTGIDDNLVRDYIAHNFGKPEDPMDFIRANIFEDAEKTIMEADLSSSYFFSLNVPTGTGKTFTSLSTALKLRKRLEDQGVKPRIIYALPFTSIIDQNYEEFRSVLSDPDSSLLLKHHHLSDISYTSGAEEFETGESKFLIESWESEIVVTTMFQVFHTIFTNRNRMIQKFRAFSNAIVLLDEVQSLPYKYWIIARKAMQCLAMLFNTRFILITATQPRIFKDNEIVELVPDKQEYFSQLDRVMISIHEIPVVLSEFTELCIKSVQSDSQSYLFVMNTVNSALTVFKGLYNSDNRVDADYFFLSTNIIPSHRLKRIQDIRKIKGRKIIVSTQMVEAGVDIDVENVWRDSGPLESVNQVCGRCNRNFSNKRKGHVQLFRILDENNKNMPFESYIYGKNPLSMLETKNILSESVEISETDFLNNMDRYYEQIRMKHRPDDSNLIQVFMDNLQFLSLYNSFRLIEDDHFNRKDVFVEYDEKAKAVWKQFMDIRCIEDRLRQNEAFLKIRKQFYDYVISIPENCISEQEYPGTHVVYINKEKLPTCYDCKTGWIRKSQGTYHF